MVYTPEEKKKMDRLLAACADLVANSPETDVAYSDKTGYVRLIVGEHVDNIYFKYDDFEDMLRTFTMDVVYEEMEKALAVNPKLTNQTMDYEPPRKRMKDYVRSMGADMEYALASVDTYIDYWKNNELLP